MQEVWPLVIFGKAAGPCAIDWQYNTMQVIFLIRQDDRKSLGMKSTAKHEHNLNLKRNSYIPKMSVDPCPVGSTTDSPTVPRSDSAARQ